MGQSAPGEAVQGEREVEGHLAGCPGAEQAAAGVGSEASVPFSWSAAQVDAGAPVGVSPWGPPASQHPGSAAGASLPGAGASAGGS